jgi:hypothetical protein
MVAKVLIFIILVIFLRIISYHVVKDYVHWTELETGDLLLFSHNSNFLPVSHVALVYRDPKTSNLLVFESISKGDFVVESHIDGVVLTPLETRLQYYQGPVVARKLDPSKRTPTFLRKMDETVKANLGRPFNYTGIRLFTRWVMGPSHLSCLLCSELTAHTFLTTGLVPHMPLRMHYPWFMSSYNWFFDIPYGNEVGIKFSPLLS